MASGTKAERRIRRTLAEFSRMTDDGDFDGWSRLFVEDGRFRIGAGEHVGRAALRAFIEVDQPVGRRGTHLTIDSVILLDRDSATVRSNFLFVAGGEDGPVLVAVGRYRDVMVPDGKRWLFQEREAVLLGPVTTRPWGSRPA